MRAVTEKEIAPIMQEIVLVTILCGFRWKHHTQTVKVTVGYSFDNKAFFVLHSIN